MIELKHVTVAYGGAPVLENFSLTLPDGAHAVLMGPSGCGKTTLLNVILGLVRPRSGSVNVTGRIACVFQEPRLLPQLTALQNVNAVLSDGPATLAQAAYWLERLGLSDAADKYPAELSGGMQQRVAVARALAYGGDILLLDEPTKGLDEALRLRVTELIRSSCEGKMLLAVTHDRAEAEAFADGSQSVITLSKL